VIFATCGSSPMPFERMMQALRALRADDLHVQHGPATPPPCARADQFLPFGRMVEMIEEADVVVSHAGVGSIMCALRAGHLPIVFPRMKRYAETVDDHQAELAEALERRGNVLVVWTPEDLAGAVASVQPRGSGTVLDAETLSVAVRSAIRGEPHHNLAANQACAVPVPRKQNALNAIVTASVTPAGTQSVVAPPRPLVVRSMSRLGAIIGRRQVADKR